MAKQEVAIDEKKRKLVLEETTDETTDQIPEEIPVETLDAQTHVDATSISCR